jgi:hypothetical protein
VRQSRARADADDPGDADDGTEIDERDEESTILVRLVTTERRTR